ncbi:MAG: hypothetical protein COB85_01215 [Bacteroidetes bacterium]|nr:MAG: hypothetical protein COB85_01215 [Bacteroidota bacterium]
MNKKSLIYRCEQIIRDLANDIAGSIHDKPFKETVIKKLKFSKLDDWNVLCSLMDVLSDTELAKENFLKYSLTGPTKILDYGEQYLRLYGLVNAIYLQKSALISFIELVKLRGKKEIINKIESLKLIELRHVVGAHTIDFLDNGTRNPHQLQRAMLEGRIIKTSDSRGNFKEYDLKELLLEYNQLAEKLIIEATNQFIKTVLKNGGKRKEKYLERLDAVKSAHNGAIVIWNEEGTEQFIVRIVK